MVRLLIFSAWLCVVSAQLFSAETFEVHEWGVYVRSQAVVTGLPRLQPVKADEPTQPILSCPNEMLASLPDFVLRHANTYTTRQEMRAWNKPVIHFYGAEGKDVTVQVKTPQGQPLAYYPKPEFTEETFWFMGSGVTAVTAMEWKGKLTTQMPIKTVVASPTVGHWWNTAREIPGMWLKTNTGAERFIFYEANAVQAPTIRAVVKGDQLKITNDSPTDSGTLLVLINDGAERHFSIIKTVAGKQTLDLQRSEVMKGPADAEALLKAAREQWESFGMTKEEAAVITEIWKSDLLEHIGVMVLARMPEADYEKMFPLTITPKPDKTVRAGLVIDELPGDAARIEWLPRLETVMNEWTKELSKEDFEVRAKAAAKFARLGDLAKPYLQKLLKSEDPEVRSTAQQLLNAMNKQVTIPNLKSGPGSGPIPSRAGRAELNDR